MTLNKTDFPLSNLDIGKMTKQLNENPNIKTVEQILKCKTLDQMFDNSGKCILWYSYDGNPNNAHWLIIVRNIHHNNKYVYFFDSFGTKNILEKDDKLRQHILLLCKNEKYKFYANEQEFQSKKSLMCGRYCLFVYALNKINVSPPEIEKILEKLTEKNLIEIVS